MSPPYNYLEGSVHVPAFGKSLLILGRESSNRAVLWGRRCHRSSPQGTVEGAIDEDYRRRGLEQER